MMAYSFFILVQGALFILRLKLNLLRENLNGNWDIYESALQQIYYF
jgi:hypothetical protein